DPPAELTHGLANGRLLPRTGEREGESAAHARQMPTVATHRTLVDVFLDLHLQQALDAKLLEGRFAGLCPLGTLRPAGCSLSPCGQFLQGMLCFLQTLVHAGLRRLAS